jgi:hypothetical protein
MTIYYRTTTWDSTSQVDQKTIEFYKHIADKTNWRIVELPNGYFQTECKDADSDEWRDVTRRETIEAAERAIDKSIEHYQRKLSFVNGPKVVKTFE